MIDCETHPYVCVFGLCCHICVRYAINTGVAVPVIVAIFTAVNPREELESYIIPTTQSWNDLCHSSQVVLLLAVRM